MAASRCVGAPTSSVSRPTFSGLHTQIAPSRPGQEDPRTRSIAVEGSATGVTHDCKEYTHPSQPTTCTSPLPPPVPWADTTERSCLAD